MDDALAARLHALEDRIAAALARSGRQEGSARLIAASKTVPPAVIAAAHEAGVALFGENRVQEAAAKIPLVPGARWHLIGQLQRNKARRAVELFETIHSVDSLRLAEALDRLGCERGRPVEILLEVNVAGEATKGGFAPGDVADAVARSAALPGVRLRGLMTIPPPAADPADNRCHFALVAGLAARHGLPELSMGMSDDYEVAIEEGATYVRIGTALFGPRTGPPFSV